MTGEVWVPRPDQEQVMRWLDRRARGAVWAGTGAGKTVMAATWMDIQLNDAMSVARFAVVAPPIPARQGWLEQMRRWSHLQHLVRESRVVDFADLELRRLPGAGLGWVDRKAKAAAKARLAAMRERVHLLSWDAFVWAAKAYGRSWPYDGVIFDESSFLRDQRSERSKAAYHVAGRLKGRVTHLLELSATPASNHDDALWNQVDLIQPGLLGATLTQFRETYCQPDKIDRQSGQVYSWKLVPSMRAQLEAKIATVAISVPDSLGIDVLEAPQWVELDEKTMAAHDSLEQTGVLRLPAAVVSCGSAGVRHLKLRQLSSGFIYDDNDRTHWLDLTKRRRLVELVESIEGQALVAYQFDAEREALEKIFDRDFADLRAAGAKGRFEAGKLKLLGVHPQSAGHGVDGLQRRTHQIIWTSVPEDRELYDQTNGRLKRPGQAEPTVRAHVLVSRGTREEMVWRRTLPRKERQSQRTLDAVAICNPEVDPLG